MANSQGLPDFSSHSCTRINIEGTCATVALTPTFLRCLNNNNIGLAIWRLQRKGFTSHFDRPITGSDPPARISGCTPT
ncbi:Protein of unknown function [Cotesia congregata]|uniref:Uncharacterized protein n=1 Tax=Cotesia congregata TaxID=51543 RepID=A0A8J2MTB4_COTCN|nr:Protein of unknown function [Cotesia congregata]